MGSETRCHRCALRNKHLIGAYLCFTAAYAFMSGGRHHHVGLFLFDIWGAYSRGCTCDSSSLTDRA